MKMKWLSVKQSCRSINPVGKMIVDETVVGEMIVGQMIFGEVRETHCYDLAICHG